MEQRNHNPMLDMLNRPAFLVQNQIISQVNQYAKQKMISEGEDISQYLSDSLEDYQAYTGGCLSLSLDLYPKSCSAVVTQVGDLHLFCLDQPEQADQALALTAQQLRAPLHSLFAVADCNPDAQVLRQGLSQIHRIVTNMADFPRYQEEGTYCFESLELCSLFAETVEKASALVEASGIRLNYTALPQCVYGFADREMLERAIYNLISNAVKFSPKNGTVEAKLVASDTQLLFTVQDQGDGIPPEILSNIFTRYLRAPGIEDSRHGVGLGLALVRTVALCHKGTVLIEQPEGGGTKVTMTISIKTNNELLLRSPIQFPQSNFVGGYDRALVELSDVLPTDSYKP